MGLAARVTGLTVSFVLLAGGGYVVADITDTVPGFLTNAPVPAPAAPFPSVDATVGATELAPGLGPLSPDAVVPSATAVENLVSSFAEEDDKVGPAVGVLVADALTGTGIAGTGATIGRTPASTAKLFTAAAALGSPGPDHTLDTRTVLGDGDQLFLVGGGDMMLAAGRGDASVVNGRAGLADLAAQTAQALKLAGIDSVNLRFDDSFFSGPTVSPTWDKRNVEAGYVAPVTALAVDVGRRVEGEYVPRFADPSLAAAQKFAAALAEVGVTVHGSATRATAPADGDETGRVSSAPLSDVVAYFLQTSDNSITEVVGRVVAAEAGLPTSFDGATAAVLAAVGRLGVDTSTVRLSDCSGLGDGSSVPPIVLVDLLLKIVSPDNPHLRDVAAALPVAGLSGTLHERFTISPARGLVRAKTGSLPGVTSLAGTTVTADGRLLVFVVMADKVPEGGAWNARAAVDAFTTRLTGCGCS